MTPKRTTITPAWKPLDAAQSTLGLGVTATCYHTGNKVVWATKSGATLAGASGHGFRCDHADLLIDAAGIAIKEVGESANCLSGDPDLVNKLQKYVQPAPKALRIEWTDYSIPRLRASFWSALLSTFKSGQRVVCACAAGDGRTGTALACLVVADMVARNGEADAAQAIRVVRDAHCERAVEAKSQARYVAAVAAWLAYVGGGPAMNLLSGGGKGDSDDVGPGLTVLAGFRRRGGLFFEMKVGAFDSPDFKLAVGYTFK